MPQTIDNARRNTGIMYQPLSQAFRESLQTYQIREREREREREGISKYEKSVNTLDDNKSFEEYHLLGYDAV
jgi:hypothetical protein